MADDDNVLNIDISADDYAKAAATDRDVETFVSLSSTTAPGTGADAETVAQARAQAAAAKAEKKASRTFQSEEDFQAEKRSYVAKNDAGGIWKQLAAFDPPFRPAALPSDAAMSTSSTATSTTATTTITTTPLQEAETAGQRLQQPLNRKQFQLVSAAVGELYCAADYVAVTEICDWLDEGYVLDPKMGENVRRWRERCLRRLGGSGAGADAGMAGEEGGE